MTTGGQVVQRRNQFPLGEISLGAKDDKKRGWSRLAITGLLQEWTLFQFIRVVENRMGSFH
jgi:hypothetical protein